MGWKGEGRKKKKKGEIFILPDEKVEAGGFFVLAAPKIENKGLLVSSRLEERRIASHLRRRHPLSSKKPVFQTRHPQSDLRSRRTKIRGSSLFGAEDRRLKMGVLRYSPTIEERGFFVLRGRRSQMFRVVRRSEPTSNMGGSSLFRCRRTKNEDRSSERRFCRSSLPVP